MGRGGIVDLQLLTLALLPRARCHYWEEEKCPAGTYHKSTRRRLQNFRPVSRPFFLRSDLKGPPGVDALVQEGGAPTPCGSAGGHSKSAREWRASDLETLGAFPWYWTGPFVDIANGCNRSGKLSRAEVDTARGRASATIPVLNMTATHVEWEDPLPEPPKPSVPLYWINLQETTGSGPPSRRSQSMVEQLGRLGWEAGTTSHRVNAVNGKGSRGGMDKNNSFTSISY